MKVHSSTFSFNNSSSNLHSNECRNRISLKSGSAPAISERLQKFIEEKLRGLGHDGQRNYDEFLADLNRRVNNKECPVIKRPTISDVQNKLSIDTPDGKPGKDNAPVFRSGIIPPPPPMAGMADFKPKIRAIAMYAPVAQHVPKSADEIRKMITDQVRCDGRPQLNVSGVMSEMAGKLAVININNLIRSDEIVKGEILPVVGKNELGYSDVNKLKDILVSNVKTVEDVKYIKSESGNHHLSIFLASGGSINIRINSQVPLNVCIDKV